MIKYYDKVIKYKLFWQSSSSKVRRFSALSKTLTRLVYLNLIYACVLSMDVFLLIKEIFYLI